LSFLSLLIPTKKHLFDQAGFIPGNARIRTSSLWQDLDANRESQLLGPMLMLWVTSPRWSPFQQLGTIGIPHKYWCTICSISHKRIFRKEGIKCPLKINFSWWALSTFFSRH